MLHPRLALRNTLQNEELHACEKLPSSSDHALVNYRCHFAWEVLLSIMWVVAVIGVKRLPSTANLCYFNTEYVVYCRRKSRSGRCGAAMVLQRERI